MSLPFLLGIDVEDPRDDTPGGYELPPRVPALLDRILEFLRRRDAKATFFVVGEVARRHPEAIRSVAAEGHELACHSDRHIGLDRQEPASFRADLEAALDALRACGAEPVRGYRAPRFSLGPRTRWAYPILAELGFRYSSSVVPAANPLHGWRGFGRRPRRMEGGLWEVPVTLLPRPFPPLPLGGVYLRALPRVVVRAALAMHRRSGRPLVGYLHPYDIDAGQERFAHAGFASGGFFDRLMYRNRHEMLERLELAGEAGFRIAPLGPYAASLEEAGR